MLIVKICKKHGGLTEDQIVKCGIKRGIQRYKCKECQKKLHRDNYLKNTEKIRERTKLYNRLHPELKKRAAKKMRDKKIKEKESILSIKERRQRDPVREKVITKLGLAFRNAKKLIKEISDDNSKNM